jgi:hypothetical protein
MKSGVRREPSGRVAVGGEGSASSGGTGARRECLSSLTPPSLYNARGFTRCRCARLRHNPSRTTVHARSRRAPPPTRTLGRRRSRRRRAPPSLGASWGGEAASGAALAALLGGRPGSRAHWGREGASRESASRRLGREHRRGERDAMCADMLRCTSSRHRRVRAQRRTRPTEGQIHNASASAS